MITYEGIESFCNIDSEIEVLKFKYCTKIGNKSISLISEKFCESLREFSVIRNFFEKTSTISDEAFTYFVDC